MITLLAAHICAASSVIIQDLRSGRRSQRADGRRARGKHTGTSRIYERSLLG